MNFDACKKTAVVFGLALAINSAWAASTTTTMAVSGTVVGACSVTASGLSFGLAIPSSIGTNQDPSAATITTTCSLGTPYTISLGIGSGSGATFAARKMTIGASANTMIYSLYTDSLRTTVWGDGTGSTGTVSGTGSGSGITTSVFGRIPSGQTVAAGNYSDSVIVTVTY